MSISPEFSEHPQISYSDFVRGLGQRYQESFAKYANFSVADAIVFPQNIKIDKYALQGVDIVDRSAVGVDGQPPDRYLSMVTKVSTLRQELHPFLSRVNQKITDLVLNPYEANVTYGVSWQRKEDFQEDDLSGLMGEEAKFEVRFWTHAIDTGRIHLGYPRETRHEFRANMESNTLTLKAEGAYRTTLDRLLEELQPRTVTLNLTQDDAERLKRGLERTTLGKVLFRIYFNKALSRQPDIYGWLSSGGRSFPQKIEFSIPFKFLPAVEKLIAKPVSGPRQETEGRIVSVEKKFSKKEIRKGVHFEVLKKIARVGGKAELGILFDHPLITNNQARELLEEELKKIEDYFDEYKHVFSKGMNGAEMFEEAQRLSSIRGQAIEWLTRENISNKFFEEINRLKLDPSLVKLKGKGYKAQERPDFISVHNVREVKQWHLLQFIKQLYESSSNDLVERYRERYVNSKSFSHLSAEVKSDAAASGKLSLPARARLHALEIKGTDTNTSGWSNKIRIDGDLWGSDSYLLFLDTKLNSPDLLGLQEWFLRELSIRFV